MSYEVLLEGSLTWNIPLLAAFFFIVLIYYVLIKRTTMIRIIHIQPLLFFTAICLLYLIIGSPLVPIVHLSFSLHMIQMSILYFIIPPIILLGVPEQLLQLIRSIPGIKPICSVFLPYKRTLYTFALLLLIYHLPFVLTTLSKNPLIQTAYLLVLFFLSFGMWWPIASPNKMQRLNKPSMKRYVFLSGVVIMPACLLFILTAFIDGGDNPFLTQITAHLCLPSQSDSISILPPPFNTKYDQLSAGIFMFGLHKFGLFMTFKLEKAI